MPQNSPITIKDGKSTPADHVFAPQKIQTDGKALFAESATTLVGRPTLSYIVTGGRAGAAFKAVIQLNVPKTIELVDPSGAPKVGVEHTCIAKVELVLPPSTTVAERKDLRMMIANALTHATIGPAIDNVESFW